MEFHEIWETINEFPKYSVSNTGHVSNNDSGVVLRPIANPTGSVYVGMFKGSTQHKRSLAKLVASEFLPRTTPAFDTPINLNGNRLINDVRNLMWRPRWFATKYHQQFNQSWNRSGKVLDVEADEVYANVFVAAMLNGLLVDDLWMSAWDFTHNPKQAKRVWPTNQVFRFL